jgi:hypothetical protein
MRVGGIRRNVSEWTSEQIKTRDKWREWRGRVGKGDMSEELERQKTAGEEGKLKEKVEREKTVRWG